MTIVDFLLARIAEDENQARWYSRLFGKQDTSGHEILLPPTDPPPSVMDYSEPHMLIGYGRVLAECAAKRAIVGHCASGLANGSFGESTLAEVTVRLLAQVYSTHPDYQPEWSTT